MVRLNLVCISQYSNCMKQRMKEPAVWISVPGQGDLSVKRKVGRPRLAVDRLLGFPMMWTSLMSFPWMWFSWKLAFIMSVIHGYIYISAHCIFASWFYELTFRNNLMMKCFHLSFSTNAASFKYANCPVRMSQPKKIHKTTAISCWVDRLRLHLNTIPCNEFYKTWFYT